MQVQNYSGCPLQAFHVWDICNRTVVNQLPGGGQVAEPGVLSTEFCNIEVG